MLAPRAQLISLGRLQLKEEVKKHSASAQAPPAAPKTGASLLRFPPPLSTARAIWSICINAKVDFFFLSALVSLSLAPGKREQAEANFRLSSAR
jgi:hypothetical protein